MHHYLFYASLFFPVVAALLAIRGATMEIRDNQNEFIGDIKRQGRWNSWAALFAAIGAFLVAWVAWTTPT